MIACEAMKCLAMRIGAEFRDECDVRYLLRHLDVRSADKAVQITGRCYPLERFPQKTLYALQELLLKRLLPRVPVPPPSSTGDTRIAALGIVHRRSARCCADANAPITNSLS